MNFTQSFKLALKSLKTSKMRAFLTMLGIIIGVCAVIVIVGLGNGMQGYIEDSFADMGTDSDRKSRRVGKECRSRWSPYH